MSHQQIPLHMHGLKDTLGLYRSEKKKLNKPKPNRQRTAARQPHRHATGPDAGTAPGQLGARWPGRCPGVADHRHPLDGNPTGNC